MSDTEIEKATDEINRAAIREGDLHTQVERLRVEVSELQRTTPELVKCAEHKAFLDAAKMAEAKALEVGERGHAIDILAGVMRLNQFADELRRAAEGVK